jgi:hypothetical protein
VKVALPDSELFGERILSACHPSKCGSTPASPNVHVVLTACLPASRNSISWIGPVAPSLRAKVYLTVPGPFMAM